MVILTPYNVKTKISNGSPLLKIARVYGTNTVNRYELLEAVAIRLTNGDIIEIPKGYVWDLSSVPRFLWAVFSPDGDFQLAALIHDYLYEFKIYSRKFADDEMLKWSKILNGTKNLISFRNFDNIARYTAVRLFGWVVWYKLKIF